MGEVAQGVQLQHTQQPRLVVRLGQHPLALFQVADERIRPGLLRLRTGLCTEPSLLGLGFGLGHFVGSMDGMPYLAFLASGIVASSAMTVSSFEGMYSVFTRMVPQRTYEAILATPLEVDDILAGDTLTDDKTKITLPEIKFPTPMCSLAVRPKSRALASTPR